MLAFLVVHVRLVQTLLIGVARACRSDRPDDGLTTLELVVLALGLIAIASIALAVLREAVVSRVDQLR